VVAVSCPELKDLRAQVRVTEPAEGKPVRGTVVLGSGGNGSGFYAGQAGQLVDDLAAMGFRVVDRSWDGGWPTLEGGMKKEACRYATLVTWIRQRFHTQGKFVATGNSGGSAEIGYALSTYGRGDILDVAVLSSGPPVSRLDYVCATKASDEWAALCASIVPKGAMECTPGCMLGPGNAVCRQVTAQPTTAQLLDDSVVHPGAVLSYPKTRVFFLFGAEDCGEPVPAGLSYATRVTSQKAIQFVPKTPHALMSTAEGREAIRKAIEQGTASGGAAAQAQDQQDFRRRTMESLTPEQRAHLMANGKVDRQAWIKAHPARESTGLIPLPELGHGSYKGQQGGLYPGGDNAPPPEHLKAGLALARKIVPVDAAGRPSPDGKIVMISVGMSNTTMKFQAFQKLAKADGSLNPKLVLVDGAQGAQVAWVTSNPKMPFWEVVDRRLEAAGVTRNQVQAAWVLQANPGPVRPFPEETKELQGNLADTVRVMQERFPNLKIAYLSSRTYGGYATSPLNPEPFAYEGGFSVKWLIGDQIAGKPELNFDPGKGRVRAPWMAWGPYLWADGTKANKDGLSYVREDYTEQDGTHPTASGQAKVAARLLQFLKSDPTSAPWFVKEALPDPNHGLYAIWTKPGATDSLRFLKGGQVVLQWEQVEREEGHYDFSRLHDQLEMIAKLDRVTTVQLNANRWPSFLFSRVPYTKEMLGKEQDRRGTVQYWHPAYVKAYTALIAEFARQVKASPHRARLIGVRFNYNAIGTEYMAVPEEWRDPAKWTAPAGVALGPAWSEEVAFQYRKTIVDTFLRDFSPEVRVFLRSGGPGFTPDQYAVDLAASGKLGFFTTAASMEPSPNIVERYEKIYLPYCRTGKTVCYAESVSDSDGKYGAGKIRHWCSSEQWNYWRLLADLHFGFSMIGVYGADLARSSNLEYLAAFEFAARYAGFHASPAAAPGAWVAMREGSRVNKGDYAFLMRRLPGETRPEEKIGPDDQRFGAWARTVPGGAQAKFALDEAFARSMDGKNAKLRVVFLDRGVGSFTVRASGREFRGALGDTGRWKTAEFEIGSARFAADEAGAHVAIGSEGGVTLHMIEVMR
jgi:hypothetical protein